MEPSRRPRPSSGILTETFEDELLLYRPDDGRGILLNPTASLVWSLSDGTRTVGEIAAFLREAYPESGGDLAAEVEATLALLDGHGAIDWE